MSVVSCGPVVGLVVGECYPFRFLVLARRLGHMESSC